MGEKEDKAKQDQALIVALDSLVSGLWNATVDMDDFATACKVVKGESLYDRVGKCETNLTEWDKDLTGLQQDLASVKKLLDGYPTKFAQEVSGVAETTYSLAVHQSDAMRATLKKARETLAQHKATLRKVKI